MAIGAGDVGWRILDTAFGAGQKFFAEWHAWRRDPRRPRILHFVGVSPVVARSDELIATAAGHPEHLPLAKELATQWSGLTPGTHRLSLNHGRVLLTLHVRSLADVLRAEPFTADSVLLDASFDPQAAKPLARHCRRGTRLQASQISSEATRALAGCGFVLHPATCGSSEGVYDPAWDPRGLRSPQARTPGNALVIGGGLAGAAAAASLAKRGWQVTVVDAAPQPAAGASGLPVGLLAPHHSPDDNLLSRLSRAGVRMTLRAARLLLREGEDWAASGALEHRLGEPADLSELGTPGDAYRTWTAPAAPHQLSEALLAESASAWWHEQAAWIRPSALVRAWLARDGIEWRGGMHVADLSHEDGAWMARDAGGQVAGRADVVVVATALGSAALLRGRLALNPVRGQISWAPHPPGFMAPPFPVNGNGHFIANVPHEGGLAWFSGSSYGRGDTGADMREADQRANRDRLRSLLPAVAAQLDGAFDAGRVQAWSGVRCTSSDRRPLVGEIEPGLWVSTAMGSRGLTFCALAAELMAARLHDEPLPIDHRLAQALDVVRALDRQT